MGNTKIYMIPYWVIDALNRNSSEVSDVFNFSKMKQLLSIEDLAGILAINKYQDIISGKANSEFISDIYYEWSVSATPNDLSFLDSQVEPISKSTLITDMVGARLFSEVPDGRRSNGLPYSIIHFNNNSIGLVINENAMFIQNANKYRFNIIRELVKQLYVYESPAMVAKYPLTLRYLELLADQR